MIISRDQEHPLNGPRPADLGLQRRRPSAVSKIRGNNKMSNYFRGGRDGMEIFGINTLRSQAGKVHIRAFHIFEAAVVAAVIAGLAALI